MYSNAGQAIAYSFVVTNTGNVTIGSIAVTDTKVNRITCPATTLALGASTTCTGTYTTVAGDVLTGSITDTATATGTFGANPVTSPAVTTTLQLDANAVRQATQSAIRNFMNYRADMITSASPDTGRMHQRLTGTLFGNSGDKDEPSQLGGPTASQLGGRAAALGGPDSVVGDDTTARRRPGRGDSMRRGWPSLGSLERRFAESLERQRQHSRRRRPVRVRDEPLADDGDGGSRQGSARSLGRRPNGPWSREARQSAQQEPDAAPGSLRRMGRGFIVLL